MMMQGLAWLQQNPTVFLICLGILGLLIGSFLNVVIYRLPIILKRDWAQQCHEYLQDNPSTLPLMTTYNPHTAETERFNLMVPSSRCPHCKHQITALENIPVFSYIFLKGRCSACKAPISWRYPVIEMVSALLSIVIGVHFGVNWTCLYALILTWSLLALSMIDFDHQMLPDQITLPLLWLGLLLNMSNMFAPLREALLGAVIGYLFLWSIFWVFKLLTGKEGMGYGDFKLLALFGAWQGYKSLPFIILAASLTGALVGLALIAFKRHNRADPIPFGPFIAIAGWLCLLWGDSVTAWYLQFAHFS